MTNVRAGAIEMINVASGVLKLDKKLGVFDLPWLFEDRDHVRRAMAAELEAAVRDRIETIGRFRQGVFQQIGAQPQKVSWGETFTALQSGVVDGAEAATYGFYEQKHFEIADYLSLTGHVYTPSFLLAAKSFMDSLTAGQRAVFIEVGRAITERAYEISAACAGPRS